MEYLPMLATAAGSLAGLILVVTDSVGGLVGIACIGLAVVLGMSLGAAG